MEPLRQRYGGGNKSIDLGPLVYTPSKEELLEAKLRADAQREEQEAKRLFDAQQEAAKQIAIEAHAWVRPGVRSNRYFLGGSSQPLGPRMPRSQEEERRSCGLSSLPRCQSGLVPTGGYNLELHENEENRRPSALSHMFAGSHLGSLFLRAQFYRIEPNNDKADNIVSLEPSRDTRGVAHTPHTAVIFNCRPAR